MNTPNPCNRCKYCWWNVIFEDDPDDLAYCKLDKEMGREDCPSFQHWKKRESNKDEQGE